MTDADWWCFVSTQQQLCELGHVDQLLVKFSDCIPNRRQQPLNLVPEIDTPNKYELMRFDAQLRETL